MLIPVNDPVNYNFAESLRFLSRSERECLHYVEDGHLYRMMVADDQPVLLDITWNEKAKAVAVDIAYAHDMSPSENGVGKSTPVNETAVRQFVTSWLHLDEDMNAFYRFTRGDLLLNGMAEEYHGLRVVGIPDLFEAICWTIIGQQINLAFAYTLRQRFIQAFGYQVIINGKVHYLHPHPGVVAALTPEQLTPMQFSRGKAAYIIALAKEMASGTLKEEDFRKMDYEAARERLVALKGIGNWSANYVLMKYGHFPQALPIEDAGLHNAIKKRLQLEKKPDMAALREYTAHWQSFAAYATFYLWRSL